MKKRKAKEHILAGVFILPAFIAFCVFMFWPLIRTIYLSFFDWNMIKPVKEFVGLQNYIELFQDEVTYKVLGNTVVYIVILLIMTIVQGLQYVYTPIKVVTQGGPNYASSNLIYQSYHEAFTLYQTGDASALSVVTMTLFIVLLLLEFKFVEKGVYYEN